MIHSSKKIKADLKSMWPMLKVEDNLIWLRAKEYPSYSSVADLEDSISKCVKEYLDKPPGYECEFNADRLMVAMWEYQFRFFGVALGTMFRDRMGNHTLNIAMVGSDFYFIDPKDTAVWRGDKDKDQPYFIWR